MNIFNLTKRLLAISTKIILKKSFQQKERKKIPISRFPRKKKKKKNSTRFTKEERKRREIVQLLHN